MSDCLEAPQGVYPDEPQRPKAGEAITDLYVTRLLAWANTVLGIATVDRTLWAGERKCIRKMQDAGLVR